MSTTLKKFFFSIIFYTININVSIKNSFHVSGKKKWLAITTDFITILLYCCIITEQIRRKTKYWEKHSKWKMMK